jgi:hypothetical protein
MVTSEWEAAEVVEDQVEPEDKDSTQILRDRNRACGEERMRRIAEVKHLEEEHADIDSTIEAQDELHEIERRDRLQEPPAIGGERQFAEEKVAHLKEQRAQVLAEKHWCLDPLDLS